MPYIVSSVTKHQSDQPLTVIRQGQLLTDYPRLGDLAMHQGELWVLLTAYRPQPDAPQSLGWYPVAAPAEVIQYLFG